MKWWDQKKKFWIKNLKLWEINLRLSKIMLRWVFTKFHRLTNRYKVVHFENPSQRIQNQPSTSHSLPGWHGYTTWQKMAWRHNGITNDVTNPTRLVLMGIIFIIYMNLFWSNKFELQLIYQTEKLWHHNESYSIIHDITIIADISLGNSTIIFIRWLILEIVVGQIDFVRVHQSGCLHVCRNNFLIFIEIEFEIGYFLKGLEPGIGGWSKNQNKTYFCSNFDWYTIITPFLSFFQWKHPFVNFQIDPYRKIEKTQKYIYRRRNSLLL